MNSDVMVICNSDPARLCAASARVSTTKGTAREIFETSNALESNISLINKVVASGHDSIIEHTVFSLVFSNVSAIVEQFIIGFRLASYTVKSRRYVDFGDIGFYTPDFSYSEHFSTLKQNYNEHMSYLFSVYNQLMRLGINKEDARFVLPYCFYSNFYCTLNARELVHVVSSMLTDNMKSIGELYNLGMSIKVQLDKLAPYVSSLIEQHTNERNTRIKSVDGAQMSILKKFTRINHVTPTCNLLSHSPNPGKCVAIAKKMMSAGLDYESAIDSYMSLDDDAKRKLFEEIIENEHARELEQANFSFEIHNLSLAGLTHITRHRMQSIIIPGLLALANVQNFIVPDSLNTEAKGLYFECFQRNNEQIAKMKDLGAYPQDLIYYYLSGNTVDLLMTTMNARSLLGFIRLRTCNRAQWEVRDIAISMLIQLREVDSAFFSLYGPSCYVKHRCPEGRLQCGKLKEVREFFSEPDLRQTLRTAP